MLLQITFLVLATRVFADKRCYFPDGITEAVKDRPCDPNAVNSVCCDPSWKCLNNKLCVGPNQILGRGSCTDPTWKDSSCPNWCTATGDNKMGVEVLACATTNSSDYCCSGLTDCCSTKIGMFAIFPANPVVSAAWDSSATAFSVLYKPTSTSSSTSSSTTSSTGGGVSTSTAVGANLASSSSSSLSAGAKAGVGIGAAVGALLLISLAFLLGRRRASRNYAGGNHSPQYNGNSDAKYSGGNYYPPNYHHPGQSYTGHEAAELDGDRR